MTEIKVTVDEQLCAASAMCKRIAPRIFDLPDDARLGRVLHACVSDDEQVKLAREAFDACPTRRDHLRGELSRGCDGPRSGRGRGEGSRTGLLRLT